MKLQATKQDSNFSIKRLSNLFPSNLSFSRRLLQKVASEKWEFRDPKATLDADGFGRYIVEVVTPIGVYSFIVFSQYIDSEQRTDRVIAQAWDTVFALCDGEVTDAFCDELQSNLTKQEAGRYSSKILSISRANKSVRMFEKIIDALVKGDQPCNDDIIKIGYIYRTTAVYGNGKFGMADFNYLVKNTSFDFPFAAQMLVVFLIREFSYYQVNHIAQKKSNTAAKLSENSKRNLGIGNSTGLGMGPYLIKHGVLLGHWIAARENSFSKIIQEKEISEDKWIAFKDGVKLGAKYFKQSYTDNEHQSEKNSITKNELQSFDEKLNEMKVSNWATIFDELYLLKVSYQTKEVIISLLLELYPDICDLFFVNMNQDEEFELIPQMPLNELKNIIKTHYSWVNEYDFKNPSNDYYFWYSSENKEEPRLGIKIEDEGIEKKMHLGIAKQINQCAELIEQSAENENIAEFLIKHPEMRSIVKRIQQMGQDKNISDIHINTLGKDLLPTDLLRCKLALLGAAKYDPKSDRWVKVTFFQGAPLSKDLPKMKHGVEHLFPIVTSQK